MFSWACSTGIYLKIALSALQLNKKAITSHLLALNPPLLLFLLFQFPQKQNLPLPLLFPQNKYLLFFNVLRRLMEIYREKKRDLHMVFY